MCPAFDTVNAPPQAAVYTVSRFNAEVRQLLLDQLGLVWIEGEISNFSRPVSGHMYFSIKDSNAQIQCAMFRGRNRTLGFDPENGMQVLVQARPDFYELRGNFQLVVNHMKVHGRGDLHTRFERLKHKLKKEGLFDPQRKRQIPALPRCIGVITSEDGAALHDILATLGKRFSAIEVIVYPTLVQGDRAPAAICNTIELANARREAEVLILARGGGSLEDLWAFNEEQVARAIAASSLPIVTGIGHEIDFTIADFVADDHAPTPTAAAQRASPDGREIMKNITSLPQRMEILMTAKLKAVKQTLNLCHSQLLRFHPISRIEQWLQRVDEAGKRLIRAAQKRAEAERQNLLLTRSALVHHAPLERIHTAQTRLAADSRQMAFAAQHNFGRQRHRLQQLEECLQPLSPMATLRRGYSVTTDSGGKIIRSVQSLTAGQKISIRIEKGQIEARVQKLLRQNSERN